MKNTFEPFENNRKTRTEKTWYPILCKNCKRPFGKHFYTDIGQSCPDKKGFQHSTQIT
jgi:hypothetical protein